MLAFVDESGDPGMKLSRGSSPFFTIAVVMFQSPEEALACQQDLEELMRTLSKGATREFHFHSDSHDRRIAVLDTMRSARFRVSAFTLNKARVRPDSYQVTESLYKNVCKMAMENCGNALHDARVVLDGSGDRRFKQQLQTYLRRSLATDSGARVSSVVIKRSDSDPLLQVADYCAGVVNRFHGDREGSAEYMARLTRKIASRRLWPS